MMLHQPGQRVDRSFVGRMLIDLLCEVLRVCLIEWIAPEPFELETTERVRAFDQRSYRE
jgi:hypothetical protein